MSLVFDRYSEKLRLFIAASDAGDQATEDELMVELDELWLRMTPDERVRANELARKMGESDDTQDRIAND
jgi:hypothetical protein